MKDFDQQLKKYEALIKEEQGIRIKLYDASMEENPIETTNILNKYCDVIKSVIEVCNYLLEDPESDIDKQIEINGVRNRAETLLEVLER